jgi:DNA invertase Pin-like site-specific DNA recombinase
MKAVLYCRMSTADQTLEHQLTQAGVAGFRFDEVVADHGISGVRIALRDRPEGRRLFDMLRAGDTLVVRWVDRLGRKLCRCNRHHTGIHSTGRHCANGHQWTDLRRCDEGPDAASRS